MTKEKPVPEQSAEEVVDSFLDKIKSFYTIHEEGLNTFLSYTVTCVLIYSLIMWVYGLPPAPINDGWLIFITILLAIPTAGSSIFSGLVTMAYLNAHMDWIEYTVIGGLKELLYKLAVVIVKLWRKVF